MNTRTKVHVNNLKVGFHRDEVITKAFPTWFAIKRLWLNPYDAANISETGNKNTYNSNLQSALLRRKNTTFSFFPSSLLYLVFIQGEAITKIRLLLFYQEKFHSLFSCYEIHTSRWMEFYQCNSMNIPNKVNSVRHKIIANENQRKPKTHIKGQRDCPVRRT